MASVRVPMYMRIHHIQNISGRRAGYRCLATVEEKNLHADN